MDHLLLVQALDAERLEPANTHRSVSTDRMIDNIENYFMKTRRFKKKIIKMFWYKDELFFL